MCALGTFRSLVGKKNVCKRGLNVRVEFDVNEEYLKKCFLKVLVYLFL